MKVKDLIKKLKEVDDDWVECIWFDADEKLQKCSCQIKDLVLLEE